MYNNISKDYFEASSSKYSVLTRQIDADLITPVSIMKNIEVSNLEQSDIFFYDSVSTSANLQNARYSIITIGYNEKHCFKTQANISKKINTLVQDLDINTLGVNLPDFIKSYFFYLSYNSTQNIYGVSQLHQKDDINMPDCVMIIPKFILFFDKLFDKLTIVAIVPKGEEYLNICSRIDNIIKIIQMPLEARQSKTNYSSLVSPINKQIYNKEHEIALSNDLKIKLASDTTKQEYCNKVKKAIEYIENGDCFQIVPSLRFVSEVDDNFEPIEFYRKLRGINPSPFMFFVKTNGFYLIGSSPEIMVRLKNNEVTIKPLAGTRQRFNDSIKDKVIAEELLADQKEVSEHLILLDLARNDIGMVAKDGTVKVEKKMEVEFYSHVMHISSTVTGLLKDGKTSVDAMIAGFPAGTLSGGPKTRAMQIIAQLEGVKRSFYSGCLGYISKENLETCIMLRTALVKDGKVYMQAGAGVVHHSQPELEYNECVNKMMALIKSLYLSKFSS
jgi:anthranilate synthase component I